MNIRTISRMFLLVIPVLLAGAGPLEMIDDTASALADFVTRNIADEPRQSIFVEPLLADVGGRTLLGERLKSALEVELADRYRRTTLLAGPGQEGRHFTLSWELQVYAERVRILAKILGPDGALRSGTRLDLSLDADLEGLLSRPAGSAPPGSGQGIPGDAAGPDPYEMEPGGQDWLEVGGAAADGPARFVRFLTPGDIDRFRFEMAAPGTVVLEAVSTLELQMLLFQEGGEVPLVVQASRIETQLSQGSYVLEVSAYDFNAEGTYEVSLDLGGIGNDSFEPDNSPAEASGILAGESQGRMMLSGDVDWVEPRYSVPGFYTVYVRDNQAGLRLVLTDGSGQEILSAESGLAVFLGARRLFVRVEGLDGAAVGAYRLVMEKFEPVPIYPNGVAREFDSGEGTVYLKLRIWQAGQYRVTAGGDGGPEIALYDLPELRRQSPGGSFTLAAGDYLLAVRGRERGRFRVCVAPADSPQGCR